MHRCKTVHQAVICPTVLKKLLFTLNQESLMGGFELYPSSKALRSSRLSWGNGQQDPINHKLIIPALNISARILFWGFSPWVFILIVLCSPFLSPALWYSPGYCCAAFFPVKEISGTFLSKLPLTLWWKCCPSPRCRTQALLGKMISLPLNIHQASGPLAVPGMLCQTMKWLIFYVLSILLVAGDFINPFLIACREHCYCFSLSCWCSPCSSLLWRAQISIVTWFPNLLLYFYYFSWIELQYLELEWNSQKDQFQGFSLGSCGWTYSQLCSLCALWMILDSSVCSACFSCSC